MRLVVGLGNPGRRYEKTPHNVGFEVVDILARRAGIQFRETFKGVGIIARGALGNQDTALLKPTTFMNLSGEAVGCFLRYHPLDVSDLLIISDDIHLPMGSLRFREGGSHGGHKGLLSIIQVLGTEAFARLRIGIHPSGGEVADYVRYVLAPWRGEDLKIMSNMEEQAADAVECYLNEGFSRAASKHNKKLPNSNE